MTQKKMSHRHSFIVSAGLLALLLTGCIGQLGTRWAGLTVLDDGRTIAYAHEDTLALIDAATGDLVPRLTADGNAVVDANNDPIEWRVRGNELEENAQFFAAPMQLDDETLVVATLDGRVIEFDLQTAQALSDVGTLVQERGNTVTDVTGTGGTVFIGLQQQLLALDSDTYSQQWSLTTDHAVWAPPLVVDDTVYVVSLDHFLYAADLESGEFLWSLDVGGAATGTPAYDAETGTLFVGTFNNTILAITTNDVADDERIINQYETDEWVWGSPVLVTEPDESKKLYAADLAGNVYKLDPVTLTIEGGWRAEVAEGAIRTSPVVYDEYVVVGSRDESVYWLDRDTGQTLESCRFNGEILSDILYFPADGEAFEQDTLVVSTLARREAVLGLRALADEIVDCESALLWNFNR
ncbi:MAG: PQQ-binding-like beta-propeller repeat protein [Chloroflexota bacterium]